MKILIIFSLIALFLSCNKSSPEFYGTASATVNGEYWQADKLGCKILNVDTCFHNTLGINLLKYNSLGELREEYSFTKLIPEVSVQKVYPVNFVTYPCNDTLDATYATLGADGDAVNEIYNTVSGLDNFIRIESYDSRTKKISGSFAITFVIYNRSVNDNTSIDTIRVTNGKFSTKILN